MKRYKDTEYFVTEDGKVFRNGKQLKTHKRDRESFRPSINGKQKTVQVHRWIAETFIPNPDNKPEINHIDGNPLNNNVSNLEWVTHQENMLHARRVLKSLIRENHNMSVLDTQKVEWIRTNYISRHKEFSMYALARKFNVSQMTIHKIIHKKTWTE